MRYLLIVLLLISGCGAHHIIPGNDGRPQSITVSGYTTSGCLENLRDEANKLGVALVNIRVVSDNPGSTFSFWPFIKGSSCTGDVAR